MKWLRRILAFALAHRAFMFLCLSIVVGVLLFSATRMHIEEDILQMLPGSDPYVQAYSLLLTHFPQEEAVVFDVNSSTGDSDLMEETATKLASNLNAAGLFKAVVYKTNPEQGAQFIDFIERHMPELFTPQDAAEFER